MGTTRDEIRGWFERGVEQGATHMIVVCDTFDHTDYPVFVKPGEDVHDLQKAYDGINMQRIMEVYKLTDDMAAQLNQARAFNY